MTTADPWSSPEWRRWLASRPPKIRAVAERFPPWVYFELMATGQIVYPTSYSEMVDGSVTMTVFVGRRHNKNLDFERRVPGITPEDLRAVDPRRIPAAS